MDTAVGWLHLPVLACAVTGIAAVLESWPAFGRDRADASWVRRLRLGPFDGALVAAAGAASAIAVCLVLTGLVFETFVRPGSPATIEEHVPLHAAGDGRLDRDRPSIDLSAPSAVAAASIELRPLVAFARGGVVGSPRIHVRAGERDLGVHEVPTGGGLVRVRADGAPVSTLRVSLEPEARAVVLLPDGAAQAIVPASTSAAWNAAVAAGSGTFGVLLALGLAIAGHRHLSGAVLHVLALATVLLATASGLAPVDAAIAAHARDTVAWGSDARAAALRMAFAAAGTVVLAFALSRGARRPALS